MRFIGSALVASAFVLGACGGGEKAPATDAATPAAAPAVAATGTAAPITGTTHEVKMYGDDKGYRFEPKDLTIKAGDGIKFVFINGGPHNVAFNPADIPADVKPQLDANFGADKTGELMSKMLMLPDEFVTISFANIKPGTYPFNCTPHLAMNMKGTVTVQ
ncbi:MAG: plastocyanin/azurin family copper-binding protein [Gemmatimonadaceae bacterium]|nr:plastocyanin/azurin family copper-binding protein [Gemmatimonadaceae bacterium]